MLKRDQYPNKRIALLFVDPNDSDVYVVISINIPDLNLETNEVIINTAENPNYYQSLMDSVKNTPYENIIEDTKKRIAFGLNRNQPVIKLTDLTKIPEV